MSKSVILGLEGETAPSVSRRHKPETAAAGTTEIRGSRRPSESKLAILLEITGAEKPGRSHACGSLKKGGEMLEKQFNLQETISYGSMKGWSEEQILADVRERIAAGEDINKQVDRGSTAIQSAAAEGYLSVVRFLIDAGADLTLKNRWKEDLMSCAKLSENKAIISLVKDAITAQSSSGTTAAVQSILYFIPANKTEAEYTFIPSKKFKKEHGAEAEDVGFFLNHEEVLKLEPIKKPVIKKGVMTISIDEGIVALKQGAWEELTEQQVNSLAAKSEISIHDIDNMIREFLSD